jgi:hypothetical protein
VLNIVRRKKIKNPPKKYFKKNKYTVPEIPRKERPRER